MRKIAAGCQARSPVRTVHRLAVDARGSWIHLVVVADAFLQHMVRNIAGVLMAVGAGEAPPDWSLEVLESRDRTRGGVTAAPEGLYLVGVDYPPEDGIDAVSPRQAVRKHRGYLKKVQVFETHQTCSLTMTFCRIKNHENDSQIRSDVKQ